MQNPPGPPRSPPYAYYATSSPPWSPFPVVSPISHAQQSSFIAAAEANSVASAISGRLLGSSHGAFQLPHMALAQQQIGDGGAGGASPGLPLQTSANQPAVAVAAPSVGLCESRAWQLPQHHQCIDMEDTIGLGRDILEADVVVFGEGIEDPQPSLAVEESPKREVNVCATSGREESNALLVKLGSEPQIGLQFRSEGEAYEYYKAYAKENGFSIRKSHVERSRVDHSLISRKFVCVKQGFRSLKDKRYEGKVVRHRRVTRVDCRAALIIKRRSGKWIVHRFHKEHNHDLGEHAKACEFPSHRKLSTSTKSILEALYKTQCIDMEETIGLTQKLLESDMMVSDKNIQDQKTSVNSFSAPNVELQMAESSREGTTVQESSDEVKHVESRKMEVNDASHIRLGSEPYVGLQFGSQEEAYEFYNAYAKEKGFSIRKSRIERSRIDHSMISRLYVCTNQGLRSTKDKRYEGKVVRPRQETRLDCRAAMFIKKRSGKWHVERFHKEHNHEFVDPAKAEKLRSHRKMTMTTKSMIEELYKCGVGPSKVVELLTALADGTKDNIEDNGAVDNSGSNESKNHVSQEADCDCTMKKERKNNIRAECYQLLDYFQEMQVVDSGFFYAVEFSENRCVRSICWVDGKAREAYKKYGDVLIFDMVCRTNKYLFPFACFSGLNHHKQPVLFGCAFMADETVESFVWLFETWLRAVSNQQPTSIITNQDKAMKVAIEKVFPETKHRFCMWYIEKDGSENLAHVFDMHPDFEADYKRCIFSSWTSKEFESGWEGLLLKYNLKDNKWLNKLYNQRHHWVPLYLQDVFFGGMTTTQKTEGMHSYFEGFLHGGTPFNDFIPNYEQAIKARRKQEANEDFATVCTRAALASKNPIEEQAAKIYTRNMFIIFQREFLESSGCSARKVGEEGPVSRYLVGKYRDKDDNMRIVTFNPSNNSASCSCQMFDSEGMLCRHVLKVFQVMDVFEIPPHCILKRWTMSDRYVERSSDDAGGSSHDVNNAVNTWTLKEKLKLFVELGETSNERSNIAVSILQEGLKKISLIAAPTVVMLAENLGCNNIQGEGVDEQSANIWTMDLNITVPDPHRAKFKGQPVSSGMQLGIDQAQKKKRTCGTCKETGHYTRTCPNAPAGHSQSPALLQGIVDRCLTSATLQGGLIHTETPGILQGSINQSQTSIMLQEPFGQGLDTSLRDADAPYMGT